MTVVRPNDEALRKYSFLQSKLYGIGKMANRNFVFDVDGTLTHALASNNKRTQRMVPRLDER